MDVSLVLAFVPVAVVLTITPGADMALVTATTFRHGAKASGATIIGICLATIVQGSASGAGLSAVIATSSELYLLLKIIGAGYLIWLGLRTLISSKSDDVAADAREVSVDRSRRFREGFLSKSSTRRSRCSIWLCSRSS